MTRRLEILLPVAACFVIGGMWLLNPDCSLDSSRARSVRSMSAARLAELHRTITDLRASLPEAEREIEVPLARKDIPAPFTNRLANLEFAIIRVGGPRPLIRLEGCMDHHLDLNFYGVGEPADPAESAPRITLYSGETESLEEILWTAGK